VQLPLGVLGQGAGAAGARRGNRRRRAADARRGNSQREAQGMKKVLIGLLLAGGLLAPIGANAQDAPKIELSHFMSAYSVADIEAVTKCYADVLDFEVVKDVPLGDAMHFRWLRHGNQGIELVQMANSQPGPERGTPPAHLMVRGPGQLMLQV